MELDVYEKEKLEDVGFLTAMMLTLLGNYAQTGHYGGPLSYTPANVVLHLLGPRRGGIYLCIATGKVLPGELIHSRSDVRHSPSQASPN